jgi:hypothetical protein
MPTRQLKPNPDLVVLTKTRSSIDLAPLSLASQLQQCANRCSASIVWGSDSYSADYQRRVSPGKTQFWSFGLATPHEQMLRMGFAIPNRMPASDSVPRLQCEHCLGQRLPFR